MIANTRFSTGGFDILFSKLSPEKVRYARNGNEVADFSELLIPIPRNNSRLLALVVWREERKLLLG